MIEQIWRNILASEEMGEMLVASHEVDDVVSLMIEAKIDPQKFGGNLSVLITQGMPTTAYLFGGQNLSPPTTASIHQFISIVDRPIRMPLWLLAGFPDVLAWLNEQQEALQYPSVDENKAEATIAELYGFDVDSSRNVSNSEIENPDGGLRVRYYRNLVWNYVQQTGRNLETAVEEGSESDIYLGNDFLQMMGEESNCTLIATITTKYYVELKTKYTSAFPDETSLLAMAGILDAQAYIFDTGQIQPMQIVDLAKATQGQKDRLLEFLVEFVTLLVSVDNPTLSSEAILEACRDRADTIQRSVRNAMDTYRGELKIVNDTRAVMTSAQFSQLRRVAGVRTPNLLNKLKNRMFG
jgi:hypothetical protein